MVGFIKDEVYYIKLFCQLIIHFFRVVRVSKIILFFSSMFSSQLFLWSSWCNKIGQLIGGIQTVVDVSDRLMMIMMLLSEWAGKWWWHFPHPLSPLWLTRPKNDYTIVRSNVLKPRFTLYYVEIFYAITYSVVTTGIT